MARARMISRCLGSSEKFAALGRQAGKLGEFAQALFPLLVVCVDDWGRMKASPTSIKWETWPSSPRRPQDFERALLAMETVGLIQLYEAAGERLLQIVGFEQHQQGLHKRTASRLAEPPPLPTPSQNFPELPASRARAEQNRTEQKGRERTVAAATPPEESGQEADTLGVTDKLIGAFLKRFCELYFEHRHGAKYLVGRARDVPMVKRLLATYGLDDLIEMTKGLLTTNESYISSTDRGIGILSVKAAWLHERLCASRARGDGRNG